MLQIAPKKRFSFRPGALRMAFSPVIHSDDEMLRLADQDYRGSQWSLDSGPDGASLSEFWGGVLDDA